MTENNEDTRRLGLSRSSMPSSTSEDDSRSMLLRSSVTSPSNTVDCRPGLHRSSVTSPTVGRRVSTTSDMVTGKVGGHRDQVCMLRHNSQSKAMTGFARREAQLKAFFKGHHDEVDDEDKQVSMHGQLSVTSRGNLAEKLRDEAQREKLQYTLTANRTQNISCTKRFLACFGLSTVVGIPPGDPGFMRFCGVSIDDMVKSYLHWSFRTTLLNIIFSSAAGWYILVVLFATLIYVFGELRPECIIVDGNEYSRYEGTAKFADCFALSWTTFSTVGYGLIFPSTSATTPDKKCYGVTFLTVVESFVGILFGSFCGAIIYGKVSRVQSYAEVSFSDPMIIRYGSGVMPEEERETTAGGSANASFEEDGDEVRPVHRGPLPCPVLEFRILNRLHAVTGGEIMDASLNCVAVVDPKNADPSIMRQVGNQKRRGRRKKGRRRAKEPMRPVMQSMAKRASAARENSKLQIITDGSSKHEVIDETKPLDDPEQGAQPDQLEMTSPTIENALKMHQKVEEETGASLAPSRIFSKLDVESPDHPFFRRVWVIRHLLDEHSPLLTREARFLLKRNNGHWPEELNSAEGVRKSFHFEQIVVSFSGTSNVNTSSVYSQKIYEYSDVNVGFCFVSCLYRDEHDGSLRVNDTLLNVVNEQMGGGAEPLNETPQENTFDRLLRGIL